jgi:Spy/CpxP family protein refolding chaperone
MKPTFQRVALAAVLGLGLVVSAAAQDRGPGPGGAGPGPRGADRQKLFEDRQHSREQRLHDLLQIKPDQEPAFRTFVSSLEQARPERGQRKRGPGGAQGDRETLTAPQRLDRQAQRLADAQQRLQKEAAAVKTFYAVLTPEQRKSFDAMGGVGLGRGHGFGRRGGMIRSRFEGPQLR